MNWSKSFLVYGPPGTSDMLMRLGLLVTREVTGIVGVQRSGFFVCHLLVVFGDGVGVGVGVGVNVGVGVVVLDVVEVLDLQIYGRVVVLLVGRLV
jgi:hypothetical protein